MACSLLLPAGMENTKPHILVVDDELGPRESLKMILNPRYHVHVAERAAQAIDMLGRYPIDLVTLDLKMPGGSGIEVLEKVKRHDPDIEAIIITGYGSLDTAIEGLRLGAFDYISKPFDVSHVLKLVGHAIERRNAKTRLRQVKSDFLSNVSHELRTPLSVVVGFVYLLLNQVIGKLTEEQQKVLETVYRNSEELLELIDNVLWMTSLNAGDNTTIVQRFDVRDVVECAVKRYERAVREKGLRLSVEIEEPALPLVSDRAKVERIFQNVFNNAVKFTEKGEIRVKARLSPDGDGVELEIADTGIGIDRSKIDTIFEPFQQGDGSMQRSFSGLGIGLTVARRMTDVIGGTLELASQPGFGTSVLMRFPHRVLAAQPSREVQHTYG
ncbi:MAG TPA: response regulator [candidate division Zixibacteria bacterium]|nr:response regulator [candidate division Zixibacteria bacterium]